MAAVWLSTGQPLRTHFIDLPDSPAPGRSVES
jgi:hypothetical protein